jgi:phosphatidylglycerophosphate synthase
MAGRDVLVGYIRLNLAAAGRDVGARFSGKVKAVAQGASGLALMAGPLYWNGPSRDILIPALSALVIFVTVVALADHLSAAWPVLRRPASAPRGAEL